MTIPNTCEDRGALIGLPPDMGPTEGVMAILSLDASYRSAAWASYMLDLMRKLAMEDGFDPLRRFTEKEIFDIVQVIDKRVELSTSQFPCAQLSSKSIAAVIIDIGSLQAINIDWSSNPLVGIQRGQPVRALHFACKRVPARFDIFKKILNDIGSGLDKEGVEKEARQTLNSLMEPIFVPGAAPLRTKFHPGSEPAAQLLALIAAGAKLDPQAWNGAVHSNDKRTTLALLTVMDRSNFSDAGKASILKVLNELGHPLELNHKGKQPLHIAAAEGYVECVRFLLFAGVSHERWDNSRKTARDLASMALHHNIVAMLDAATARQTIDRAVQLKPPCGITPLSD